MTIAEEMQAVARMIREKRIRHEVLQEFVATDRKWRRQLVRKFPVPRAQRCRPLRETLAEYLGVKS